MSRPLRVLFEGAYYHVMNRGRNHQKIFYNKKDFEIFLQILRETCTRFNVQVIAYCLMDNHYHLVIQTPDANLSSFMRQINGVYTQKYNRRYQLDGTLFRGRYKAILVSDDHYLFRSICYTHKNPLKAKLVRKPEDYIYSSCQLYFNEKEEKGWLVYKNALKEITGSQQKTMSLYKQYMRNEDKELDRFFMDKKSAFIMGDDSFKDIIHQRYIHNKKYHPNEISENRTLFNDKMKKKIKTEIQKYYLLDEKKLHFTKRGINNQARQLAIVLIRELTSLSLQSIANEFKLGSYKTIQKHCVRFKEKYKKDVQLQNVYDQLKKRCIQVET